MSRKPRVVVVRQEDTPATRRYTLGVERHGLVFVTEQIESGEVHVTTAAGDHHENRLAIVAALSYLEALDEELQSPPDDLFDDEPEGDEEDEG